MDWPTEQITGLPLHFLGQIDLSALPRYPMAGRPEESALPSIGMLFFFCLLADRPLRPAQLADLRATRGLDGARNATRVLYADTPGPDRPVPDDLLPSGFIETGYTLPVVPLQAFLIATSSDEPATFDAIVSATGDPAPVITAEDPQDHLSYFIVKSEEVSTPVWSMLAMFKDKRYSGGDERDGIDETPVLLMSFADRNFLQDVPGVIEYWILPSDLRSRRFDKSWAINAN